MPIHNGNLIKHYLIKYEFDIYVYNFEELIVLNCDLRISTAEAKNHQKLTEKTPLFKLGKQRYLPHFDQKGFQLFKVIITSRACLSSN